MTWDPDTYPTTIRADIHDYEELQHQVAQAAAGITALSILDLGIGTGETASRILDMHPRARLVGIDSSAEMLRGARRRLPEGRVTLLEQDLGAPLPDGKFDLIVSALAIHHLEGAKKADLFVDVTQHLSRPGLFVMGDVVVPDDPADALIENEAGYDFPSTIDDQLRWLTDAGLSVEVAWLRRDLAVFRAESDGR